MMYQLSKSQQDNLRTVINFLRDAATYADDVSASQWEFASQIQQIRQLGALDGELRWLIKNGYAAHRVETTKSTSIARTFKQCRALSFTEQSCFVITSSGQDFAAACSSTTPFHNGNRINGEATPHWNSQSRELWFGESLIKRFHVPAPNQQLILDSFEAESWPDELPNPFDKGRMSVRKQRLRTAIQTLNRNHHKAKIRFSGNGRGTGIRWEQAQRTSRSKK